MNHLMDFSDSSWQDCPDTGRSTGAYIILYQGGPIDNGTHVLGPVAQSSACCVVLTFCNGLSNWSWNMFNMVNWPSLIENNIFSCTSSNVLEFLKIFCKINDYHT